MKGSSDQEFPSELEGIVGRLRDKRATADPLVLDQIKGRVMRGAQRPLPRIGSMKQRLATGFTLLVLVGGSGGALAIAGSGGGGQAHSAATSQYKSSKGCTVNHHHYKTCPKRYPHHFHCYYRGHYYNMCPYGKAVKGVHAVRHRRHHKKAVFTG